ncbi:2-haloalkanoic acid dehalogenase [Bacillus sp. JCM 19047]|uniref:HAD family hydrolase n=1 Tax=Shouchella miscanthi TaxID=2598861 RepID=A0ABU6NUJ4_9BACI|nr:HAD family hydrolase [Shouchella miscanthi]MED4130472.1 HAD family hydrolase [Shouchella miscanthi]GAF23067.1 2-haloalkanoic acid dehalogenase [Bacillus sp. JCM 19047]
MLKDIQLILFDLDNTLYDFNEKWNKGTYITFNNSKLTKGLKYEEFITQYRANDLHYWNLHHKGQIGLDDVRRFRLIDTLSYFERNVTLEQADQYFNQFIREVFNLIKPDSKVNSFLLDLNRRYKIGLITNGKVSEQRSKISKLDIDKIIPYEDIFISDAIGHAKPHPQIFLSALAHFNTNPEKTIYVGDSWENDVIGSEAVGINPIWINSEQQVSKKLEKSWTYKNIYSLIEDWQSNTMSLN